MRLKMNGWLSFIRNNALFLNRALFGIVQCCLSCQPKVEWIPPQCQHLTVISSSFAVYRQTLPQRLRSVYFVFGGMVYAPHVGDSRITDHLLYQSPTRDSCQRQVIIFDDSTQSQNDTHRPPYWRRVHRPSTRPVSGLPPAPAADRTGLSLRRGCGVRAAQARSRAPIPGHLREDRRHSRDDGRR